jgi:hypothetical protein
VTLPPELIARIEVADCWTWTGATKDNGGGLRYGVFTLGGRKGRQEYVHRLVWRLLVGPVPRILHHQCVNRLCCNPDHLMPTTHGEHPDARPARKRAQTMCVRGHALKWGGRGRWRHRYCPTCNNARRRAA